MSDHTKIPIDFDPIVQRMKGVTRQGGLAFDVPFISHIGGNLYVGGCKQGLVLPSQFRHLVSLYPWERYKIQTPIDSELYIKAYDADVEHIRGQLERLTRWTLECVRDGKTLVHCQAGLNRSNLIAALVLIEVGRSPEDAIALLRKRRCSAVLCNTEFERYLLAR